MASRVSHRHRAGCAASRCAGASKHHARCMINKLDKTAWTTDDGEILIERVGECLTVPGFNFPPPKAALLAEALGLALAELAETIRQVPAAKEQP